MLLAEFDTTTQTLVALIDDTLPIPRQPTGHSPAHGAEIALVEVLDVYPDPYVPGYPELEGPFVVEPLAGGRLVRSWPSADFSPARLRQALADRVRTRARLALGLTDWTVVRRLETGKPIPADVVEARAAVREWCEVRLEDLRCCPIADLLAFSTALPADLDPFGGEVLP